MKVLSPQLTTWRPRRGTLAGFAIAGVMEHERIQQTETLADQVLASAQIVAVGVLET